MSTTANPSSSTADMASLAQTELEKTLNDAANKRLAIEAAKFLCAIGVIGAIFIFVPFDPTGLSHMLLPLLCIFIFFIATGAVFHSIMRITREKKFAAAVKKYYIQFYNGLSLEQVKAEAGVE